MEVYEKRGRWVVESAEGRKKFATKAEAEAFAGLAKPAEIEDAEEKSSEIEEKSSEEKADTYKQKTVRSSKGYGKKKI